MDGNGQDVVETPWEEYSPFRQLRAHDMFKSVDEYKRIRAQADLNKSMFNNSHKHWDMRRVFTNIVTEYTDLVPDTGKHMVVIIPGQNSFDSQKVYVVFDPHESRVAQFLGWFALDNPRINYVWSYGLTYRPVEARIHFHIHLQNSESCCNGKCEQYAFYFLTLDVDWAHTQPITNPLCDRRLVSTDFHDSDYCVLRIKCPAALRNSTYRISASFIAQPLGELNNNEKFLCNNLSWPIAGLYNVTALLLEDKCDEYIWHLEFAGKVLDPETRMTLKECGATQGSSIVLVLQSLLVEDNPQPEDERPNNEQSNGYPTVAPSVRTDNASMTTFRTAIQSVSKTFVTAKSRFSGSRPSIKPARTGFLKTIAERGLLPTPAEETNWSGKGQFVEYGPTDDPPLEVGRVVGYSANALVQEVVCRRIKLARKSIPCKRLSLEDSLWEVSHLQKIRHAHVVRLIGSYLQNGALNILLYPLAEWNLQDFIEITPLTGDQVRFLHFSINCLGGAVGFIHEKTIRHMDIKPLNILVKRVTEGDSCAHGGYQIFLADFDVAVDYRSSEMEQTNSPRRFTELYASPEAADSDFKGPAADVFALGCVFIEMLTAASQPPVTLKDFIEKRRNKLGQTAYCFNITFCVDWLHSLPDPLTYRDYTDKSLNCSSWDSLITTIGRMLNESPKLRPDLHQVISRWGLMCRQNPLELIRIPSKVQVENEMPLNKHALGYR